MISPAQDSPSLPPALPRVRPLRLWQWLALAAVLAVAVALIAPQQLPVLAYKVLLLTVGALAGYWLDRSLFPYARPDWFLALHAELRIDAEAVDEISFNFGEADTQNVLDDGADDALVHLFSWCMARRAAIVLGAMIAVSLGA